MVIKAEVLNAIKHKNIQFLLSDRVGESNSSGGDVELCLLAGFLDYHIYYNPAMQLEHHLDNKRLSKKAILKRNKGSIDWVFSLYILDMLLLDKKTSFKSIMIGQTKNLIRQLVRVSVKLITSPSFHAYVSFRGVLKKGLHLVKKHKTIKNLYSAHYHNLYQ